MILEIFFICSIITTSPYSDCSEEWKIILVDDYTADEWCKDVVTNAKACAKWYDNGYPSQIFIEPRSFYLINHEFDHLMCRCNFH